MDVVPPGSTIGILGSGQLGRMLAQAAQRLGYRVAVYSPEADSPAGQVADREVVGGYDDATALAAFAHSVDVLTFEFENVPAAATRVAERSSRVRPAGSVLATTQHRLTEKRFLAEHGFPIAPFVTIESLGDVDGWALPWPAVLKTAGFGYDGKGQLVIADPGDPVTRASAAELIAGGPCVLEAFVSFASEASVVVARGQAGESRDWRVIDNRHRQHILDVSRAPAGLRPAVEAEARRLAHAIARELDAVGVIAVEFFVLPDGQLLVNEIAPRVHNSGHLTADACVTGQFEQHIRAICGLPLGDTDYRQPAAMVNLLGDLWAQGEPDWSAPLADPAVKLYLYGKREPRPGRKMGHLVVQAATADEAAGRADRARAALTGAVDEPAPH